MARNAFAMVVAFVITSSSYAQDVDPESVLKRFVGDWKTEITIKAAEWNPEERTVRGEIAIKPILRNRFIEETGTSLGDETDHRVLWGYDTGRQVFRCWFFDSNGAAIDWSGKWNERTKTIVSEASLEGGIKAYSEHHFVDANNYEWKTVAKDAAGKVYLDMQGKHTRVKDRKK
jgi:hypothetical protein